ncbi:NAD(P)-dependent dehydrogenase (short-subunit alcohol dehydrogenase family) [Catenuloplanes nepalensis]|uniref:NAD(P)-dependent dehydrogenase (Short-subunit alcohol dehydrogenase family) n=1 Tax=Catenuloplanes nepalensis TaxID=587533 RepID=A0ABT9MNF4_9ACTN|nr:SDR family NAD(P)-dependent oxidoreductase [Catenuloplanes nepalensis]MDP9792982.1 NAD(P)-dependent dehydrogenase (short-subunit alcohol dehydrogenase family) [Catenuloplanes nepalensis]
MNDEITGTVAITGAGMGLGLALTRAWAERGATVLALIYEPAQQAAVDEAVAGLPGKVETQVLDVTRPGDFTFPEDAQVLINNAGIRLKNYPIEEIGIDEWRLYMEVNFLGAVELTRRVVPVMRAGGGGVVVNINSGSLTMPYPFLGPYRAAKGAMAAFTETLRAEVGQFGIRVLEFLPGAIRTGLSGSSMTTGKAQAADLPAYAALADAMARTLSAPDAGTIIVDAIDAARQMVTDILAGDGFRFATDENSQAALERWRADGGRPVVDGFIAGLR